MTTGTVRKRPLHTASFYGDLPLRDSKSALRRAREVLKDVDFDTVVATGMSGIPLATLIGHTMRKHVLLVRKADDHSNHHGHSVVGRLGRRWIFVDDFISSGGTMRRCQQAVKDLEEGSYPKKEPSTFVGRYLFNNRDGLTASGIFQTPEDF